MDEVFSWSCQHLHHQRKSAGSSLLASSSSCWFACCQTTIAGARARLSVCLVSGEKNVQIRREQQQVCNSIDGTSDDRKEPPTNPICALILATNHHSAVLAQLEDQQFHSIPSWSARARIVVDLSSRSGGKERKRDL